ncbi:MAG: hypothetical protein KBB46_03860 [Candidatus Pacebacteria bacterium]|nr:hypothetical protein [Candidatus Paceibacterota bacterium]
MKKITPIFLPLMAFAVLLSPAFALAEEAVTTSVNAGATVTTPAGAKVEVKATAAESAALMRGKDRGNQEIDRRVTNLNALILRVQGMKNLSDADKASIAGTLTAQVNALNALKAKINADTDLETLKGDVKSITDSYRIYALIIPQGGIITAADRIVTISTTMQLIAVKFETRIAAAAAAGNDVTALRVVFEEYKAKLADASLQAQAAVNAIVTLVPDNGDAAKKAANTKALKDARAQIVVAQKALQTARKDADKIIIALKGMKAATSTTTTTETSAGATTGQ